MEETRWKKATDLEDVRIIPAFAKRRMREDKPRRFLKTQQALFVFENQIICGDIIREFAATLERTIDRTASLLIDTEIALMRICSFDAIQIAHICRIEELALLIEHGYIFLLKDLAILAQQLIALLIILAILRHLVNEEE